jgi:hypothetical protein
VSARLRAAVIAGAVVVLGVLALVVFVLPFAYPTPPPIVTQFRATSLFSPNGDGRRDVAVVSVRMHEPGQVTLQLRDGEGNLVARLADNQARAKGSTPARWLGRDTRGNRVPDGTYALELRARAGRKEFNASRKVVVDTAGPGVDAVTVESAALVNVGRGQCRLSLVPRDDSAVTIEVAPDVAAPAIRRLGRRPVEGGEALQWTWDGRVDGKPVVAGLYVVRATLGDVPGNRVVRERSCWVGHIVGRAIPASAGPGDRVGVRLTGPGGTPLPPSTPVRLTLHRRTATPGQSLANPIGARVAGQARGPHGRVSVRLPRRLRPDALWLVAATASGRTIVPLGVPRG